jgi:hypothetical protein
MLPLTAAHGLVAPTYAYTTSFENVSRLAALCRMIVVWRYDHRLEAG